MKKYTAVIIGAGSIGALKPNEYDYPEGERILTIAHAMYNNPQIDLVGILDTDKEKANLASIKWNTKAYTKMASIPTVDVVAVCTPTETHFKVIMDLLHQMRPKIIIAEKPFCDNLEKAVQLVYLCKSLNVHLIIDYIRRYDPIHREIRKEIQNKIIHHAKLTYTRGLVHEACHAIDLFRWFFGEYADCVSLPLHIVDRSSNDPTYPLLINFGGVPVSFNPVDGNDYAVFEIDIFTNNSRIVLTEHGTTMQRYGLTNDMYGNYKCMSPLPGFTQNTELTNALRYLIGNALNVIEGTCEAWCSGEDAVAVHKIYKKFKEKQI